MTDHHIRSALSGEQRYLRGERELNILPLEVYHTGRLERQQTTEKTFGLRFLGSGRSFFLASCGLQGNRT